MASASSIKVVTSRREITVTGYVKTVRQLANDVNNEWGIERVIVVNVLNPPTPPLPEHIAAMIRASEFKGLYAPTMGGQGGMIEG